MFTGSALDVPTLLLFGHLTLLVQCAALIATRAVPGQPSRSLRLWVLACLLFLAPGPLLAALELTVPAAAQTHWPAAIRALCTASTVFLWMSLCETQRPLPSWRFILSMGVLAALVTVPLAALMPPAWSPLIVPAAHCLLPLVSAPCLLRLVQQGRGGCVTAVMVVAGSLPSLSVLLGYVNADGRDPSLLILCDLLMLFGGSVGMLLWHQERMHRQLERHAHSDALTGALNRHGLMPQLAQALELARRHGHPVSVALCDLDHFKKINDQHGHGTGDDVLRLFVDRAGAQLRSGDLLGRWGGEEFLMVLPHTQAQAAAKVLERLQQTLRATPATGLPVFSFSAGVVCTDAGGADGRSMSDLLETADRLLYVAKQQRARVVAEAA